jgi:UDP-N-acetylglucosamine 3-dehydrogenase
MDPFRVGIIGCGQTRASGRATGAGISHRHAEGYNATPDAEIVALADIVIENAEAFQALHGGDRLYTDYQEMLAEENLDIVSVCTWPHLHASMVIAACKAGVKAVHCEKPMAPTYGEAVAMVRTAEECGVQLTFNHQRRFGAPFRKAKELLKSGAIGDLVRLEASTSNMYDWGTHWFDMLFYYNDETPVEWVIGQVDPREGRRVFGVYVEGQGISYFRYQNGVYGLMVTGKDTGWTAENRLVGTQGVIEVGVSPEVPLRVWGQGQTAWEPVEVHEGIHAQEHFQRAIIDLVDALRTGREPETSGARALRTSELIFATYESSRRRGRVDLPLDIEDSPLLSLLEDDATSGVYEELDLS